MFKSETKKMLCLELTNEKQAYSKIKFELKLLLLHIPSNNVSFKKVFF